MAKPDQASSLLKFIGKTAFRETPVTKNQIDRNDSNHLRKRAKNIILLKGKGKNTLHSQSVPALMHHA